MMHALYHLTRRLTGFLSDGEPLGEGPVLDAEVSRLHRVDNLVFLRFEEVLGG